MKSFLFPIALVVLILGGIAAVWSLRDEKPRAAHAINDRVAVESRTVARVHAARTREADPIAMEWAALAKQLKDHRAAGRGSPRPASGAAPTTGVTATPEEEDIDPISLAFIALPSVGIDPDAEAYWLEIINNPDVSPEDREDLIEDLNEAGISDDKQPVAADLPLIEARIALIERIAPNAMDQTNADAFKEALKDLKDMRAKIRSVEPPAPVQTDTEPTR